MRPFSLDLNTVPEGFPSPVCFWLELLWLSTIGLYACSTPLSPYGGTGNTRRNNQKKGELGFWRGAFYSPVLTSPEAGPGLNQETVSQFIHL